MAKVVYVSPVKEVSGKISKKDKVIYQVRKAPTSNQEMLANPCYTSAYGVRKTPYSATEIAYQTRFGKVAKATTARLADPSKKAQDQAAFKNQTEYKTLRQYVWHQCSAEIE